MYPPLTSLVNLSLRRQLGADGALCLEGMKPSYSPGHAGQIWGVMSRYLGSLFNSFHEELQYI